MGAMALEWMQSWDRIEQKNDCVAMHFFQFPRHVASGKLVLTATGIEREQQEGQAR
jgi:hypothetical protein